MITVYLRSTALSKHLSNASGEALPAYLQRSSNHPAGRWPVSRPDGRSVGLRFQMVAFSDPIPNPSSLGHSTETTAESKKIDRKESNNWREAWA